MRTTFIIRTVEKDVSLPTGVAKRGSNYHLQIKVPLRLRPHFPGPFWIRTSLGTSDKRAAAALALQHWAEASAAFAKADALAQPPAPVKLTVSLLATLHERIRHGILLADDVVRSSNKGTLEERRRNLAVYDARQAAWLQEQREAAALGDTTLGRQKADMLAEAMGITIDWTHAALSLVELTRTALQAHTDASRRSEGAAIETPPYEAPSSPAEPPKVEAKVKGTPTLTDAFDAWKIGKKPDAVNKTTRALALVKDAGIAAPLRGLTRHDALTFRDHINATMAGTSGKTRSDVLASVQALLNFAVKEKGWIDANPWAGTAIAKGRAKKREPWDDAALRTLLHSPLTEDRRVGRDAQYWIPLLALMTSARQAELCQLRTAEVIQRDGVWLLDLREEQTDQNIKSDAGVRRVAVHSKLIQLGFIEYVERMRSTGESLVFPGILANESRAASVYVSDWFRDRCRALGIYQPLRDFHALRTTIGTALRAVHPPLGEAIITAVMGHEAGNVGMANYHRPAPKTLQRAIETLDFPAVLALSRLDPRGSSA